MKEKHTASHVGQLRRGVADHCVLALLEHGECYGFELAKNLSEVHLIARRRYYLSVVVPA